MNTDRQCRDCGITHIEPGTEIDGEPLAWVDDDLCTDCQDIALQALERDAARYRFLRNQPTRPADISAGGVFAGRVPDRVILGGEHLDFAVDGEMGKAVADNVPLETRLAACLASAIDLPLLTLHDPDGNFPMELRLSSFNRELADRAAELLEEAGL